MNVNEVDAHIQEYIVSLYLLKAVERDRKQLTSMKLYRCWDEFFERISVTVERYHVRCRKILRDIGCRIVSEDVLDNKHIHVMYVYRRYEHHCYFMPMVLKARCEECLKKLWEDNFFKCSS